MSYLIKLIIGLLSAITLLAAIAIVRDYLAMGISQESDWLVLSGAIVVWALFLSRPKKMS